MWIQTKGKVSVTEKGGGGGYSDEDVPVCVYLPTLCLLQGENKKSFTQV